MKSNKRVYIVPTRYGFLYAAIVFFLVSLATIFNSTDLLLGSALLVTFGIVCMHQTHLNVVSLNLSDIDTQSGFAGEQILWRFKISNDAAVPSYSVDLMNEIIDVPAREVSVENIPIFGEKRGVFKLESVKLSSTYPLGLFYAWKQADLDVTYYVYPALGSPSDVFSAFNHKRPDLDSRDDFIGHREFLPGDSALHIDWKVQARKQKLLIKLFESAGLEATILDWHLAPELDVETKLSLFARAVFECNRTGRPFGMILPDLTIEAGTGNVHYQRCLQYLATFGDPRGKAS